MSNVVEWRKTCAEMYRDRTEELRVLAEHLKSEEHKRLLRESAENYERLAEMEDGEVQGRKRFG